MASWHHPVRTILRRGEGVEAPEPIVAHDERVGLVACEILRFLFERVLFEHKVDAPDAPDDVPPLLEREARLLLLFRPVQLVGGHAHDEYVSHELRALQDSQVSDVKQVEGPKGHHDAFLFVEQLQRVILLREPQCTVRLEARFGGVPGVSGCSPTSGCPRAV